MVVRIYVVEKRTRALIDVVTPEWELGETCTHTRELLRGHGNLHCCYRYYYVSWVLKTKKVYECREKGTIIGSVASILVALCWVLLTNQPYENCILLVNYPGH